MIHDIFLIKMVTWKPDYDYLVLIQAVESNKITEYLNLYSVAKNYEIPIEIPTENVNSEYAGKDAYVDDIKIHFGDQNSCTALEVFVEVI